MGRGAKGTFVIRQQKHLPTLWQAVFLFLIGIFLGPLSFSQAEESLSLKIGAVLPLIGQIGYTDVELLRKAVQETGSQNPRVLASFIKALGSFKGKFESVIIRPNGDIPVATHMELHP